MYPWLDFVLYFASEKQSRKLWIILWTQDTSKTLKQWERRMPWRNSIKCLICWGSQRAFDDFDGLNINLIVTDILESIFDLIFFGRNCAEVFSNVRFLVVFWNAKKINGIFLIKRDKCSKINDCFNPFKINPLIQPSKID